MRVKFTISLCVLFSLICITLIGYTEVIEVPNASALIFVRAKGDGGGGGGDYDDITFWWTCDSETFDSDDYSAGDNTPDDGSTDSAIDTTNQNVGSGCVDLPTVNDMYYFDISSDDIIDAAEGGIGFWWEFYRSSWGDDRVLAGFANSGTGTMWINTHSSDTLELNWEDGTNDHALSDITPPTTLGVSTWYFVEVCWKVSTNYLYMSVDDEVHVNTTSNTIIDHTINQLVIGSNAASTDDQRIDNFMVSNDSTRCTAATDFYSLRNETTSPR